MKNYFNVPFIQIENYTLDVDVVKLIPEEMARYYQVVALEKCNDVLIVGMVKPEDDTIINILEARLKHKIIPVKVDIQNWANAINNNYVRQEG